MAAPTLITSYAVYSAGVDTSSLVTPSFTPSNGEVIVVKLATWDANNGMGTVSGGGQTYTTRVTGPTSGFNGWVRIVTAVISGSPGSMTVTAAVGTATNTRHSMVVERWTGRLAATPAVNSTTSGTGAPSANITTAAANSAVSWVSVDVGSQDPATKAYRLSATEDGLYDGHVGSNSVHYFAYAGNVGAAGTYAMGMTAPGSQTWVLAGIEIQGSSGTSQAISVAGETDSAQALGHRKARVAGPATETSTAQPLARRKTKPVGPAAETDAAQTVGRRKTRALAVATLTETAMPLGRVKARALPAITLTTAAQTLGRAKSKAVNLASEIDTAMTLTGTPAGASVTAAVGEPLTSWTTGAPRTAWSTGQPESSWSAGVPSA